MPDSRGNRRELRRNFQVPTGLLTGRVSLGGSYLECIVLKTATVFLCLATTIALGGCATQRENRILSDSAIGAGGGALLGAVAGFNPLVGAAVGGAGGAAVGAATH